MNPRDTLLNVLVSAFLQRQQFVLKFLKPDLSNVEHTLSSHSYCLFGRGLLPSNQAHM